MCETATKLLEQLLALLEADRAAIADRLDESLGGPGGDLDPAFEAELNRRLESVANGTAELIDGKEALVEARERLRRKREQ